MDNTYCVEIDHVEDVHIATITTPSGLQLTAGSRHSAYAALCKAFASLLPQHEPAAE